MVDVVIDLICVLSTISEIRLGSISFFCAFIPGASGRSAGGINLSIPIGMFYFIKGSGYAITTLTSSYI